MVALLHNILVLYGVVHAGLGGFHVLALPAAVLVGQVLLVGTEGWLTRFVKLGLIVFTGLNINIVISKLNVHLILVLAVLPNILLLCGLYGVHTLALPGTVWQGPTC